MIGVPGDAIRFKGHTVWLNGTELSQSVPNEASTILAGIPNQNIENSDQANVKLLYEIRSETNGTRSYFVMQKKDDVSAEFLSGDLKILPDMIWVMGDNRDNSLDSRTTGPYRTSEIFGMVR